jgi:hypothetical protein
MWSAGLRNQTFLWANHGNFRLGISPLQLTVFAMQMGMIWIGVGEPQFANVIPGVPLYEYKPIPGVTQPGTVQWLNPNAFVSTVDPSTGACYGGDSPKTCQFGNLAPTFEGWTLRVPAPGNKSDVKNTLTDRSDPNLYTSKLDQSRIAWYREFGRMPPADWIQRPRGNRRTRDR